MQSEGASSSIQVIVTTTVSILDCVHTKLFLFGLFRKNALREYCSVAAPVEGPLYLLPCLLPVFDKIALQSRPIIYSVLATSIYFPPNYLTRSSHNGIVQAERKGWDMGS